MNGYTDETFDAWYERLTDLERYDYDTADYADTATPYKEPHTMLTIHEQLPHLSTVTSGLGDEQIITVYSTESGESLGYIVVYKHVFKSEKGAYHCYDRAHSRLGKNAVKTLLSALKRFN